MYNSELRPHDVSSANVFLSYSRAWRSQAKAIKMVTSLFSSLISVLDFCLRNFGKSDLRDETSALNQVQHFSFVFSFEF